MNFRNTVRTRIAVIVLFWLFILALSVFDAQGLFYQPSSGGGQRTPENMAGLPFEGVHFTSQDGTRLYGWYIPALGETRGVVLHVHGNGGHLNSNLAPVIWLPPEHYAVFMFDYRGYGLSEDRKPNPKALMEDTQSAIAYLKHRPDIDASRLLILAQSLGGNNTVAALAHEKFDGIAGIVLESTFYSYKTIANDTLPGSGLLLDDDYSANRFIRQLSPIPLLFLHGAEDRKIPYKHSQMLFDAAAEPKQIVIVPGTGHMGVLYRPGMQARVLEFFDACLRISNSKRDKK